MNLESYDFSHKSVQSYQYGVNTFAESTLNSFVNEGVEYADALSQGNLDAIEVAGIRVLTDFFGSHHYYAAIYAGFYTFFRQSSKYNWKDFFNLKILCALLFSMGLHALWNGVQFIDSFWIRFPLEILDMALCTFALFNLLQVGIAQYELANIAKKATNE